MKNKPLFLKLFPLFSFAIALSFPLQIRFLYGIPLTDVESIFSMLTPMNIISMTVLITTGILTASMSHNVYKTVPVLLVALFLNNAIVGLYGSDYTMIQVGLSFVLFAFSLKPFYAQEIKAVIENPKLRWWETPKRYKVKMDLKISNGSLHLLTETDNISSTGIFTAVEDKDLLDSFNLNDVLEVNLGDKAVKAKVVRINERASDYMPLGYGLQILQDESHKDVYLPWFKENIA